MTWTEIGALVGCITGSIALLISGATLAYSFWKDSVRVKVTILAWKAGPSNITMKNETAWSPGQRLLVQVTNNSHFAVTIRQFGFFHAETRVETTGRGFIFDDDNRLPMTMRPRSQTTFALQEDHPHELCTHGFVTLDNGKRIIGTSPALKQAIAHARKRC